MTGPGLVRLEDELRLLRSEERPSVIRAIAESRSHGDLSENAEYHAARDRQSFIEGRIQELEEIVSLGVEDEKPARRRPRAGGRHPQLDDIAAGLSDRLETRVGITLGKSRGKVTIDFASVEDLNRILDAMHLRDSA